MSCKAMESVLWVGCEAELVAVALDEGGGDVSDVSPETALSIGESGDASLEDDWVELVASAGDTEVVVGIGMAGPFSVDGSKAELVSLRSDCHKAC